MIEFKTYIHRVQGVENISQAQAKARRNDPRINSTSYLGVSLSGSGHKAYDLYLVLTEAGITGVLPTWVDELWRIRFYTRGEGLVVTDNFDPGHVVFMDGELVGELVR